MTRHSIDTSRLDPRIAAELSLASAEPVTDELHALYQLCRTLCQRPVAGFGPLRGSRARAARLALADGHGTSPTRWIDGHELERDAAVESLQLVVLEHRDVDGQPMLPVRTVLDSLTPCLRPGALVILEEDATPEARHVRAVLARSSARVATFETTLVLMLERKWLPEDLIWVDRFGPARVLARIGRPRECLRAVMDALRQGRNGRDSSGAMSATLLEAAEVLTDIGATQQVKELASRALELAANAGETSLVMEAQRALGIGAPEIVLVRRDVPEPHETHTPCSASEDGSPLPLDVSDLSPDLLRELDQVCSQITRAERQFLFKFFSTLWSGDGDVLEMGPFLGSSTRAIALGMMHHPNRQSGARLISVDRFDFYCVNAEDVERWIDPVFDAGLVDPELRAAYERDHDFRPLFDALHSDQRYAPLLDVRRHTLPSDPVEGARDREPFPIEDATELSAVFVDGCKNWHALKAFMRAVLPKTRPGAVFLFQDYSWMDCYFVPVLTCLLSDALELSCFVDNTYVFRLVRPVSAHELDERVPDTPERLGRERLEAVFAELISRAEARGDQRCLVVYPLQLARAISLLGDLEDAWKLTESVRIESKGGPHAHFPELALAQPFRLPARPYLTLAQHLGK